MRMLRLELIFTSSSEILNLILFYKDLITHASHVKRDWTGCNLGFKKWGSAQVFTSRVPGRIEQIKVCLSRAASQPITKI